MASLSGKKAGGGMSRGREGKTDDEHYFESYAHLGIHQEMIRDRARTEAYLEAIKMNAGFIKGKVVLDVGCGTGILSIFAARAGARKVYAVDASDIALKAQQIVAANGLAGVITVLHGKVEEVEIEEKADVLVSEWMGYALLYESMLQSVIFARNKWLKPGGLMLPSHAKLYIAPITHADRYADAIDFWRNVYGIDMSALIPDARKAFFGEPCIDMLSAENVLAWAALVKMFDCATMSTDDLAIVEAEFSSASMVMAPLHGFGLWFDVSFENRKGEGEPFQEVSSHKDSPPAALPHPQENGDSNSNGKPLRRRWRRSPSGGVLLSTAPEDEPTHWAQTVLYIDEPIEMDQDQVVSGSLKITPTSEHSRFLNIEVLYRVGEQQRAKSFTMR